MTAAALLSAWCGAPFGASLREDRTLGVALLPAKITAAFAIGSLQLGSYIRNAMIVLATPTISVKRPAVVASKIARVTPSARLPKS